MNIVILKHRPAKSVAGRTTAQMKPPHPPQKAQVISENEGGNKGVQNPRVVMEI